MKKTRFTENQIIAILKEGEAGVQVKEICQRTLETLFFDCPLDGEAYASRTFRSYLLQVVI